MASKSHCLDSRFIQAHSQLKADAEVFLDLDLSQLAHSDVEEAIADQVRIWHEFSPYVPLDIFCQKRLAILESLKHRTPLYFSKHYRPRQALAVRNLTAMQEALPGLSALTSLLD